jgi:DNA-binding CsgD family transcriptional regulator
VIDLRSAGRGSVLPVAAWPVLVRQGWRWHSRRRRLRLTQCGLPARRAENGDRPARNPAAGAAALDPEVIAQILAGRRRAPLEELTPRERDVLALMAEGRANAAIARRLLITEKGVSKHVTNIFVKLGLPPSDNDRRRVLAVLTYLNAPA